MSPKLAKLLRLLTSDKDGEALAATAAIKRTLAAENSDIHEFVDSLCRPQPKQAARPPPREVDAHYMALACRARGDRLSQREQEFVSDMIEWTALRAPSEKQQAWLAAIYRRVC
jgi:hypothetical protein